MAMDESIKIGAKTWGRSIDSINKVGYSDGVVDGENSSYQSSFDMGYKLGFEFGSNLGLKIAIKKTSEETTDETFKLVDPRRINCQICLNHSTRNENIVNLYNKQLEENNNYFSI